VFIKLERARWLILISVIVFPAMLYLTRPVPAGMVENIDTTAVNKPIFSQRDGVEKRRIFIPLSSRHIDNSRDISISADVVPDLADRADMLDDESAAPVHKNNYWNGNASLLQRQNPNYTPSSEAVENNPSSYVYTTNSNVYQETGTGYSEPAAKKANNNQAFNNINTNDNPYLYDAGIESQIQNNTTKCPPVYMAINDYSRNIRAGMGCDSE